METWRFSMHRTPDHDTISLEPDVRMQHFPIYTMFHSRVDNTCTCTRSLKATMNLTCAHGCFTIDSSFWLLTTTMYFTMSQKQLLNCHYQKGNKESQMQPSFFYV